MLVASGELQQKLGGPSIDSKVPRRSIYIKHIRNTPDKFLHAFDVANGLMSVSQRNTTTTPTQSLMLINGDYLLGRAQKLADRLQANEQTVAEAIRYAVMLVWGREPSSTEVDQALIFLNSEADFAVTRCDYQRLVDYCQVLFNSNEFIYVD